MENKKDKHILGVLVVFFILLIIGAGMANAATKGDQQPFAKYGKLACPVWDGGSSSLGTFPVVGNQNAIAVQNNGFGDGGTAGGNIYIGFDTSLTPSNGFIVSEGSTISIDLVSLGTGTALSPKMYCTKLNTNWFPNETRYIVVK